MRVPGLVRTSVSAVSFFIACDPSRLAVPSRAASLFRFEIDGLGGGGNFGALRSDRVGKLFRTAVVHNLTGRRQPFGDDGSRGHGAYVGRDFFLELVRQAVIPNRPTSPSTSSDG